MFVPGFKRHLLATAMVALMGTPCRANDTSSGLAAGGLVFVKTDAVAMQREDLNFALDWITVRYEMRNALCGTICGRPS